MSILEENTDWGLILKRVRQRQNLKQEAAAALLGVSQPYVSRLEQGGLQPSRTVQERIRELLETHEARPVFEDWRRGLALSQAMSSLTCERGGRVQLVEVSAGVRELSGDDSPFRPGMTLNGAVSPDADEQLHRLGELGLFQGTLKFAESVWSALHANRKRFLRTRSVPVRDDLGAWHVFSTHSLIDEAQYRARIEAGAQVRILTGHGGTRAY